MAQLRARPYSRSTLACCALAAHALSVCARAGTHTTQVAGVPIPDLSIATMTLVVPDASVITDVNCTVLINHTYDGDLVLRLKHPDGTTVVLASAVGAVGDNFRATTFDDEAAVAIGAGTAPFRGSFRPMSPLSAFDGKNAQGTWVLEVLDQASNDTGQLLWFSLAFDSTTTVATTNQNTPGLGIPIADQSTTGDTLTVTGAPIALADVNVSVDISHPFDSDLTVRLRSPDNTVVTLWSGVGGAGDNFVGTSIDDQSLLSISSAQAPFRGRFRSATGSSLAQLAGRNPNGIWTLEIQDAGSPDGGMLNEWWLSFRPVTAPLNDVCATALPISEGTLTGTTVGALGDGDATCASGAAAPDVWYSYTPTCDGLLVIDTCGANYDTLLSVYSGCPGTLVNQLACDDDGCGGALSRLSLPVSGGTPYRIRVSGNQGGAGAFALTLDLQPTLGNDLCGSAVVAMAGVTDFSTCGANTDGPDEGADSLCAARGDSNASADVWHRYTATCSGPVRVSLCGSSFDTRLAIYTGGCPAAPGFVLACNDDDGPDCSGGQSSLEFLATAGTEYLIRIGGFQGASGAGVLTITPPAAPVAPTRASVDRNTMCSNDSGMITLTAEGGSGTLLQWCADSCDGAVIGTGPSIAIDSPEATTTYFARWESSCGVTECASVTVTVSIDDEPPTIECSAPIVVNAEAGRCAAVVNWAAANVSDNCGGTLSVAYDIDFGDDGEAEIENQVETSQLFEAGHHRVIARTMDAAGNSSSCSFVVIVNPVSDLLLSVKLAGILHDPSSDHYGDTVERCIELTLQNCSSGEVTEFSQVVPFPADPGATNGLVLNLPVQVPCGAYTCITALDRLHSLRRKLTSAPDFTIVESQFVADFTGETRSLIGGDLLSDQLIDILDFGVYITEFNRIYPSRYTDCDTPYPHADLDGDSVVFASDITFINSGFLKVGDAPCCAAPVQGRPERAIPVWKLVETGMPDLVEADLNQDGILDELDVVAFLRGARPAPRDEIDDRENNHGPP